MILRTTGGTSARALTDALIAEIEATDLHRDLLALGFRLQPFRIPRGLAHCNLRLRLRLAWKKESGGEIQTVRFTHIPIAPTRA